MNDKYKAQKKYRKEKLKTVGVDITTEEKEVFVEACKKLGISQTSVLKQAINDVVEKANKK